MKRTGILGLAIVLTLGLGVAVTQAKPKKVKVETAVSIESYSINDPSDFATLGGIVAAGKPRCARGRTVELRFVADGTVAGTATSDDTGSWSVSYNPQETGFGDYEAIAEKRKIKKKRHGKVRRVIVCDEDVSPPYPANDHP